MANSRRTRIQRMLAVVGVVVLVAGAASVARAAGSLLAAPATTIDGTQDEEGFGYSIAIAGDVNGDGYDDLIVGSAGYDGGQTDEGAAFVFLGGPEGIASGDRSTAATVLLGPEIFGEFLFGYSVASAGDVNGDEYDDVIVNNPLNTFLYLGGPGGIPSGDWSTAAAQLNGGFTGCATGVGDVNGDGYDDIAATTKTGLYVVHGGPGGIAGGRYSTVAATSLVDAQGVYGNSWTVAGAGDVNGDGYDDVIVGVCDTANNGVAFVLQGSPAGIPSGDVAGAATVLRSDQASVNFGATVDGAGDTNGDGYDDVIVGALRYDSGLGAAFVFRGGPNGVPSALAKDAPTILRRQWGAPYFANRVAGAGDVNGDGYSDVVVNFLPFQSPAPPSLVFLGSPAGTSFVAACTLDAAQGPSYGDYDPVAGAGDVNGDGYDDIAVGVYSYPDEIYKGRVVVYQGGVDEWKLLAYDYNSLWARTAKIGEAYDYSLLRDYPTGFGPWTHVASGPRYTFFYNSSTGVAGLAVVSTSGVVTTLAYWGPGSFGVGWTHVVWHGDNLFFYCSGNGLGSVGRIEGPDFVFYPYNSFTMAAGWTHIASVQGYLLLYKAGTGAAYACQLVPAFGGPGTIAAINLRYVRAQTFSTGWTHIVDSKHGVLFYNGSNGGYRVGDFDGTGYLTTRTAPWPPWSAFPLWKYTTQRSGWTQVVASGDRLLFYNRYTGEGVTGYVRTPPESQAEQAEPLGVIQTYGWGSLSYPGQQQWSHIVPIAPW